MNAAHRSGRRPAWKLLGAWAVALGILLAPVFFIVMYLTVTSLLRSSFGAYAWTVPVATEGSFVLLFMMDIVLQLAGKPMGWLRWTPYPFAAASLVLNVWAYKDNLPGMVGHAAVTLAFFVPIIAGERAVKSLTVTDEQVRTLGETAAACRYARDLARDAKGIAWRWRVPSLLRTQIVKARPPADVARAIADGPSAWEPAVDKWFVRGLTRGAKVAADEKRERRTIAASAAASSDASGSVTPERQKRQASGVSGTAAKRARVTRILVANPDMPRADVARKAGVSESTVDRVKREMPAPLHAVGG